MLWADPPNPPPPPPQRPQHDKPRPHVVIVPLPRIAFLAGGVAVVPMQDAKPRTMFVVHEVLPAVGPYAVVPLPIPIVARAHSQNDSGGHALGLHPVVFAVV